MFSSSKISKIWSMILLFAASYAQAENIPVQLFPGAEWKQNTDGYSICYQKTYGNAFKFNFEAQKDQYYKITWQAYGTPATNKEFFVLRAAQGERVTECTYNLNTTAATYTFYYYATAADTVKCVMQNAGATANLELHIGKIQVEPFYPGDKYDTFLPDPAFESPGLPLAWKAVNGAKMVQYGVKSSDFITGTQSMFLKMPDQADGIETISFPFLPRAAYQISFWVKSDQPGAFDLWFSASPPHNGGHFYQRKQYQTTTQWQQYTLTVKIGSVEEFAGLANHLGRLQFRAAKGSDVEFLFDDIQIKMDRTQP